MAKPPARYDLELFERLNERYRTVPLVPKPGERTPTAYAERAGKVLDQIRRYVEVEGKDVLEIGCGQGWLTAILPGEGGVRHATGIDVREGDHWRLHNNPGTSYVVGDLSQEALVPDESIDLVLSAVVFEHVRRPLQMLEAIHRALRPGGQAWLYFNLYRGPKASHTYRQVYFPWPHLLFDDAVCMEFYERHHGRKLRFSWVNKLTAAEYLVLARAAGFETTRVDLSTTPLDIELYREFEDRLGRYPALDLETDFMTMVLHKVDDPTTVWQLDYLDRQRALDEALRAQTIG